MIFKLLLLLLLSSSLGAAKYLQKEYSILSDKIMLSDIIKEPTQDRVLYTILENRHSKRVKERELLLKLKKNGYTTFSPKHRYIQFTQKSPIDTQRLEKYIEDFYTKKYKDIEIEQIDITPRGYMHSLPKEYTIGSDNSIHLDNKGIFFIQTPQNRKIFFDYTIKARVALLETRESIRRATELSRINTKKKSIMLKKFRAMPLQELKEHALESKHKLKKGSLLTERNVVALHLVKRGSNINVTLHDGTIAISFMAQALQSGRYAEIISVRKSDATKLKVKITGKNRAEIR